MVKILIIEDHKDLRDDVIEMLELEGYEAYGAEDGLSGIEIAKDHIPDLIVCDIMMPGMNGYEVLETLREYKATATIPFIFLTARAEKVSFRQGMMLGADDYLTKPLMVSELLESIQTQLRRRSVLNEAATRHMEALRENIATALPHELRTPLNTVIGFSEMLKSEAQRLKPDQIISWADHINTAARRLHRLVENYLYYVRLQVAHQAGQIPKLDETEMVYDVAFILEEEALRVVNDYGRYDDLVLEIESGGTLALSYTDFTKIVQELVDNAIKFSEQGTPINVIGRVGHKGYELHFIDQGIGISPEKRDQIGAYMQFERLINEQQGMGLGLAIVDLITKTRNLDLNISNDDGKGTRVSITIPIHNP